MGRETIVEKKKEYTDFDDMKNIFQYTHRRMGLGFAEEQFGENKGVVKGISKKQLVGTEFENKKKRQIEKKQKEKEMQNSQQIQKEEQQYEDKEDKEKLEKGAEKKKQFALEIKTSKKKNKQKVFKII